MRSVRIVLLKFLLAVMFVSAERHLRLEDDSRHDGTGGPECMYPLKAVNLLWQPDRSGRNQVWPVRYINSNFHIFFPFWTCVN